MKKQILLFTLSFGLILSCTEDEENESIVAQNVETINYIFNNEIITVRYSIDEVTEDLIPIEDESFELVDNIYENNETLIQHYIDESTFVLFENDEELNKYLDINGQSLEKTNTMSTAASSPYQSLNLELYIDCCWDRRVRITWAGSNACWGSNDNGESRLKDLSSDAAWSRGSSGVLNCNRDGFYMNQFGLTNPNNRLNSVFVKNVFARFYDNPNYAGRSITLDARSGNKEAGFRKLRKVRNRGTWGNRISSIKLSF